jgi:hypothetical protein
MGKDYRDDYRSGDEADDRDDDEADSQHQPNGGRKPSRRSFPREPPPLHAELTCADGRDQRDDVHNHGPRIHLNVALDHPENENGRRNQSERSYPQDERRPRGLVRRFVWLG